MTGTRTNENASPAPRINIGRLNIEQLLHMLWSAVLEFHYLFFFMQYVRKPGGTISIKTKPNTVNL